MTSSTISVFGNVDVFHSVCEFLSADAYFELCHLDRSAEKLFNKRVYAKKRDAELPPIRSENARGVMEHVFTWMKEKTHRNYLSTVNAAWNISLNCNISSRSYRDLKAIEDLQLLFAKNTRMWALKALRDDSDTEVAWKKFDEAMNPVHYMLSHFNLYMTPWHGSRKEAATFCTKFIAKLVWERVLRRQKRQSEVLTDKEKREMLDRAIRTHGFREEFFNYHLIALM
jgi:hypothetical protein